MAERPQARQRQARAILALVIICTALIVADIAINISDWLGDRGLAVQVSEGVEFPTPIPSPVATQGATSTPRPLTPTSSRPTEVPTATLAVEDEA